MTPKHEVAVILTEFILFLHVLWCGWVLLGWSVTRGRCVLRSLHIISVVYAIIIELIPWPLCPLTVAENWLESRAGREPAQGPFLMRFFDSIVYPNLPEWLVIGSAVVFCLLVLVVYLRRYLHRNPVGVW